MRYRAPKICGITHPIPLIGEVPHPRGVGRGAKARLRGLGGSRLGSDGLAPSPCCPNVPWQEELMIIHGSHDEEGEVRTFSPPAARQTSRIVKDRQHATRR